MEFGNEGKIVLNRNQKDYILTNMIILSDDNESEKADAIAAIKVGVRDWFDKSNMDKLQFYGRVKELAEGIPPEEIERIFSIIRD